MRRTWKRAFLSGGMALGLAVGVTSVAAASVQTDRWLYSQGDTVQITGDQMATGETVGVDVFLPDGTLSQHHDVTADETGAFADSYTLAADAPDGIYEVVATGATSGAVFTTQFDPTQYSLQMTTPSSTQYSDVASLAGALTCNHTGTGPDCPSDLSGATVTANVNPGHGYTTVATTSTLADGSWSDDTSWQVGILPSSTTYPIKAGATGGPLGSNDKESDVTHILVTKEDVVTSYTGETSGLPNGLLSLDATVVDNDGSAFANDPNLAGTVTFQLYSDSLGTLGDEVGGAVTRTLTAGTVQTGDDYTLPSTPGTYYMKATYGGDSYYNASLNSPLTTITVGSSCTFSDILPPVNHAESPSDTGLSSYKYNARGVVPIKFQLTCDGNLVDTQAEADAHPMTLSLTRVSTSDTSVGDDTLEDASAGSANTGDYFRFDDTSDQYIYNRVIKGLAAGIWRITATTGGAETREWFKIVN